MVRPCAKFFPKFLTNEQKNQCREITQDNSDKNLLKKVITGDELRVSSYDLKTKHQSSHNQKSVSQLEQCQVNADCFIIIIIIIMRVLCSVGMLLKIRLMEYYPQVYEKTVWRSKKKTATT